MSQSGSQSENQSENKFDSAHDLQHFLKLAHAQVQSRRKKLEQAKDTHARQIRLLEELIREQIHLPGEKKP